MSLGVSPAFVQAAKAINPYSSYVGQDIENLVNQYPDDFMRGYLTAKLDEFMESLSGEYLYECFIEYIELLEDEDETI